MFQEPLKKKTLKELALLIENAGKIVITCHVKPDGDAVGSTLALWHVLGQLGKDVYVVTPDVPPAYLKFLPGFREITPYSQNADFAEELIKEANIIFCLDFNAAYRVDRMEQALIEAKGKKIMIDHHLDPENFVDIIVSMPQDSSTCYLLFKVICQLGWKPLINKETAGCLAAGMMTDTGNFSYNANDPDIYRAMAELLATGIDKVAIWDKLNVKSESQLRLNGYAVEKKLEILGEGMVAVMSLTKEELERFNYRKGDIEGLVNVPLQIPEVKMSVLMHEEPEFIKVSMRSQGKIAVNEICEKYFSGGGHLNAAGGEFRGSMEEAHSKLVEAISTL